MGFFKKAFDLIKSPSHSRTFGLIIGLILLAAVSLTVIVAQQQQQIKQRAATEYSCTYNMYSDSEPDCRGVIIFTKTYTSATDNTISCTTSNSNISCTPISAGDNTSLIPTPTLVPPTAPPLFSPFPTSAINCSGKDTFGGSLKCVDSLDQCETRHFASSIYSCPPKQLCCIGSTAPAQKSPDIRIKTISVIPNNVQAGQNANLNIVMENIGKGNSSRTIYIRLDKQLIYIIETTLAGGASETIEREIPKPAVGSHFVDIVGGAGTFFDVVSSSPPTQKNVDCPTNKTCSDCISDKNCAWAGASGVSSNFCTYRQERTSCPYGFSEWYTNDCANNSCQNPSPTPKSTAAPVLVTTCPLHDKGDANCDGTIDVLDFNIWRDEFTGVIIGKKSDFNNDGLVDIEDFNIWRDGFSESLK